MSDSKKNLSSFFHKMKFIVFKRVRLKNALVSYSVTSFFHRYIPQGKF